MGEVQADFHKATDAMVKLDGYVARLFEDAIFYRLKDDRLTQIGLATDAEVDVNLTGKL